MSNRMLQHDATAGRCWSPGVGHGPAGGQVLLQQPQQFPAIRPFQGHRPWPVDEQVDILSKKFYACLQLLIRQGFGETEARLSLLRNRFDVDAATAELHHAAFVRKLRRASQTRAELGYTRPDVYKCGHKCLQKYQPCLSNISEASGGDKV